jgi:hypothetical protein
MNQAQSNQSWRRNVINFDRWSNNAYGVYEFTARNQRHFFRFDIRPHGGVIRAYIVEQPGYGSRPADGHSTHRLSDGAGRTYICIERALEPTTVPQALGWAVYWAEMTSEYIDTGKMFS